MNPTGAPVTGSTSPWGPNVAGVEIDGTIVVVVVAGIVVVVALGAVVVGCGCVVEGMVSSGVVVVEEGTVSGTVVDDPTVVVVVVGNDDVLVLDNTVVDDVLVELVELLEGGTEVLVVGFWQIVVDVVRGLDTQSHWWLPPA